ncbi:hypothetical protein AMR42_12845 [Limnothrix sp. PR1529]|nr:hypothetical protein BCR12_11185 [Limnothrix sp. P13C2]PIB09288.1 hypothetical protein AMR42_12845 [Limnothrix sp. PR1529]
MIFRDIPRQVSGVARSTVVRLMSSDRAGSGTLVGRSGRDYWVLTNWHVVAEGRFMTVLAPDGQRYRVLSRQRLGENDLALVGFRASTSYPLAILSEERVQVGDPVFAVGYAMYDRRTYEPTLNQGLRPFRLLSGWVSLILPKPMPEGYQLGYTSPVEVGMSGGPVLDRWGAVVGVNGRSMGREADFGVYTFADGTDPDPELLITMERSSWGIPITRRLIAIFSLSLER